MGEIPQKRWELKTKNGYEFLEVVSTLQKTIRRGLIEDSFYWALELSEGGYHPYLWNRLKVIANEDIGIADPLAIILIHTLAEEYHDFIKDKKRQGSARLCLANAILYLCRAKKTRAADDLQGYIRMGRDHGTIELKQIPDYGLDKHTKRGRMMGRKWDHWIEEGCKLINENKTINKWASKANQLRKKGEKNKLFDD